MPKIRVTSEFRDARSFSHVHPIGEVLEISEEGAARLVALSLAEILIEDDASVEQKKPRPRRRKSATENTVENDD